MKHTLKTHLPTGVILLVIVAFVPFSPLLKVQTNLALDVPPLTLGRDIGLLAVGLAAGFLGGIIGTGGCSVMLHNLRYWV